MTAFSTVLLYRPYDPITGYRTETEDEDEEEEEEKPGRM